MGGSYRSELFTFSSFRPLNFRSFFVTNIHNVANLSLVTHIVAILIKTLFLLQLSNPFWMTPQKFLRRECCTKGSCKEGRKKVQPFVKKQCAKANDFAWGARVTKKKILSTHILLRYLVFLRTYVLVL